MPDPKADRIMRLPEVQKQYVPYSKAHIDRLEKAGQFPSRVKIGPARIGWWESEILSWLASKRAA